jgi:imidazolonepropionase-like amidohydrolase
MRKICFVLFFLLVCSVFAQDYFPDNKSVKQETDIPYVFTNATIVNGYDNIIKNGQMMIKSDRILKIGNKFDIPKDAIVIDLKGKYVYPSFVEVFSDFGIEKFKRPTNSSQPQYGPSRTAHYWNDHIRPEQQVTDHFTFDKKKAKSMREAGYGVVNTHVNDGIIRGTSMLVALSQGEDITKTFIKDQTAQIFSFDRSKQTRQSYPSSIMGKTALLRQVYNDASWYAGGNAKNKDLSLEAFNKQKGIPQIFQAEGYLNALRADKLGDEFGVQYTIIGNGDEYKRIDEIKNTNAQFILPLNFPKAYDVENPYLTQYLSLSDMKHWHQAPYIFKMFEENDIPFAITAHGLKSPDMVLVHLKTAIEKGLSKQKALDALTASPAQMLKLSKEVGSLNEGVFANFFISSGDIFEDKATIYQNWVMGKKHEITDMNLADIAGKYSLSFDDQDYDLEVKNNNGKYSATLKKDTLKYGTKLDYKDNWIYLTISEDSESSSFKRLAARVDKSHSDFEGKVFLNNGKTSIFYASYDASKKKDEDKKSSEKNQQEMIPVTYPNMSFGFEKALGPAKPILFKNVTVITGEDEGTLIDTDVLLKDGKIAKIGKNIKPGKAKVIDGQGKYLTAGIVDEHSHIAGTSINESGQNSSAEVTMEDAINPDDISIYRALAGGVTSIQLLHGSANPIGGRSAILKLKWGAPAEEMIYENSPKFIKFALGENVKQSNWGSKSRFPQTRMGVEQVFIDYFSRAKAYGEKKNSGEVYRKDLEMETLLEIINSERFISCHSYVQSEINMLMKVAEQFDFRVNTFTHILEGYKVADKMAEHGAGGSTFSDWWAYKFEVNDAIPYNAAIMHNEGVTVAINSDDGEMMRRLNQEAAKSVKYGGVSEEEAWKFVTLNPAKLLHIDDKVGSIKEGKDADVVLWNEHPLSVYAKPEYTIIEGNIYFSLKRDEALKKRLKEQRSHIINMMLKAKNKGMKTQPIKKENKEFLHCDSEIEIH